MLRTPARRSKVFPCALATALDIGLSNTSLKSITLTLYTMCKSSNLVFVLLFAFLFKLEKLRWNLVAVIIIITVGVSRGPRNLEWARRQLKADLLHARRSS